MSGTELFSLLFPFFFVFFGPFFTSSLSHKINSFYDVLLWAVLAGNNGASRTYELMMMMMMMGRKTSAGS